MAGAAGLRSQFPFRRSGLTQPHYSRRSKLQLGQPTNPAQGPRELLRATSEPGDLYSYSSALNLPPQSGYWAEVKAGIQSSPRRQVWGAGEGVWSGRGTGLGDWQRYLRGVERMSWDTCCM